MALVKYNNRSILNVTALDSITSGSMNLITTNTISSGVSSSSFTSNIDSTYDTYLFKFINMHPATDDQKFTFNLSIDGGSNYNVTKTTTAFRAYHTEDDSATSLSYRTGDDLAQSTSYQGLTGSVGNDNDQSCSGELFLFSPSNTTFVKHFITNVQNALGGNSSRQDFIAGYANTTSAINAIDFKFASGNIDSGVIKMYGLSKS
jgi:hypothetical protein